MPALTNYIYKRPNSQFYQLRKMVPPSLQRIIGRKEFTKSLGVTDRREAEKRAFHILTKWEAEIAAASSIKVDPSPLNDFSDCNSSQELAISAGYRQICDKLDIRTSSYAKKEALKSLRETLEERKTAYLQDILSNNFDRWKCIGDRALSHATFAEVMTQLEVIEFYRNLAIASVDAISRTLLKLDGAEHTFSPSPLVQSALDNLEREAKIGEKYFELFERYAAQRIAEKKKRTDSVEQDRIVISQFFELVGRDRAISSLESADIRHWQDISAKLPSNFSKMKLFAGLTLQEIASHPESSSKKHLSKVTIQRQFSAISGFLGWCVTQRYANKNPCDGLGWNIPKGSNPYPPFSIEQLNKIFRSPLFTGFEKDGREHVRGTTKANDWRYWIPIICLFTGARIGEIAQLKLSDISTQHEIPVILIKNDEKSGQSTKSGKSRFVPISKGLERCGFMTYFMEQQRKARGDKHAQLFPELTPNKRGQISATPSRFWREYLTAINLKKGNDGYGSHSFRHTLADELRLADYLDSEIEVALGHNQKTVTSGYGRLSQGTAKRLNEMFNRVEFQGLDIAHLHVISL